jgi:nitroreductase
METMQAIKLRKSVRGFTDAAVSEEQIEQILAAASEAPVGMGKFEAMGLTVVRDRSLLDKVSEVATHGTSRAGADIYYGAPVVILITSAPGPSEAIAALNAGAIAQTILLATTDLGLDSVLVFGSVPVFAGSPELATEAKIPQGQQVVFSVAIGHGTPEATKAPKRSRVIQANHV